MPGPGIVTPAMVVGAIRYGETSRILRLSTRELGLVGVIARGASRSRSRFAGMDLLTEGLATIVPGRGELDTLTEFELTESHLGLARSLAAFRAAAALAELAARTLPSESEQLLHRQLVAGIHLIEAADAITAELTGLTAIWRFVAAMGHAPSLDCCADDGIAISPTSATVFSVRAGGLLCDSCARGRPARSLASEDIAAIRFFLHGSGAVPDLDCRHARAHRRLLVRWIREHLTDAVMPALEQWLQGDDA